MSGVILLAAYGAGRVAIDGLRLAEGATRLERAVLSMAMGLDLLSLLTLFIGLAGWLQAWLAVVPVLGALAACGACIAYREVRNGWQLTERGTFRTPGLSLGLVLAAFCAPLVLGSLLPPWDFDVREYHLQVPKQWFQQGQIDFLPHNVYGNMPLGAEMHPLLAMAAWPGRDGWFYGALAGKVVMASYTLVAAAGLVAAGERFGSRLAGLAAATIYVAHPWVMHVSISGLNDGALAANVFLAAYATWLATSGRSSVLLAGFLAGAAAACKYPGLVFAVAPLTLGFLVASENKPEAPAKQTGMPRLRFGLVWGSGNGRGANRVRLAALALFLAGSLAGGGGWYVKNWLLAGNPVYPLAYNTFGGRTRTRMKDAHWRAAHLLPRDRQGRVYSPAQLYEAFKTAALTSDLANPLIVPLVAAGAMGALAAIAQRWRQSSQE
jgi:hypothetical protein